MTFPIYSIILLREVEPTIMFCEAALNCEKILQNQIFRISG